MDVITEDLPQKQKDGIGLHKTTLKNNILNSGARLFGEIKLGLSCTTMLGREKHGRGIEGSRLEAYSIICQMWLSFDCH